MSNTVETLKVEDPTSTINNNPYSLDVDSNTDEDEDSLIDPSEPKNVPESIDIGHLSSVFLKLFQNEPFLGAVSMAITKLGDNKQPTAYIGVRPNGKTQEVVMGFNPKFMDSLTESQQLGVIKHELLHMVFQHIFTRSVGEKSQQMLWNYSCFPAGTLLSNGSKIEDPGQETYGQTGKVKILQPMSRNYNGKLYNIKSGGMITRATDEHPFRTVKRLHDGYPIELSEPEWTQAKDLTKNHYLIVPKLPGSFSDETISLKEFMSEVEDSKGRMTSQNRVILKDFPINEDTAWLLGLYTAEGSGKSVVNLSLGTHETDLISKSIEIGESLGYTARGKIHYSHDTSTEVSIGGPILARAFQKWCGSGAYNKKIPEFILFNENLNILKAYISGLCDGDGHVQKQKGNKKYLTHSIYSVSELLISQVRLALARLDIGTYGSSATAKPRWIGSSWTEKESKVYNICWTWEINSTIRKMGTNNTITTNSNSWKLVSEGIAMPIKNITEEDYDGLVYNISTEDHTYIVNGMLVHNCDLAINSIIGKENLPDMCLIPGHAPIDPKTGKPVEGPYAEYILNAPLMMASDYYYEGLKKIQEQQGDSDCDIAIASGLGTMDDHGKWSDLPADIQEQIRDKMRDLVGKAAQQAQINNSWGSIPQEIQSVINKMLSREVDWRSVLRNFVGRTRTLERTSTVRKVNKKTPYIQPGVRRPTIANFVCMIDQSGSMSDDDIALLFGEFESLANLTTIDVYHFDTEIDENSHTVWKKGAVHPKPHRTRCGGTDFSAVSNFLNRKDNRGKYSGCVIATDGYADIMPMVNGTKILWVITPGGTLDKVRPGDLAVKMSVEKQFKAY